MGTGGSRAWRPNPSLPVSSFSHQLLPTASVFLLSAPFPARAVLHLSPQLLHLTTCAFHLLLYCPNLTAHAGEERESRHPRLTPAIPASCLPSSSSFGTRMGATVFVQPLDLVKNRMQLSGEGAKTREYKTSFHALTSILRAEGLRGIYTGLSAGLLRQATYTTTRLGIYTVLFERLTGADGTPPGFLLKALIGMTAGATGAFVGTPAEVALIRMTADGRLPPDQRRGYKNVFNALIRIAREEGVPTLWRGCIPTMARAVVVNAAQLASYSQSKQFLLDSGYFSDNILCHFCASMISGLVTTAASMPVDIVKTRIQNMRMIDGKPEYKNGLDVLVKVVRYEGFFSLWKGFTPYYARLGPHTVLTFIFLEQMNKAYKRVFLSG
ncbi:mitochondrial 2-oxoglutarate/malate carrier protein isoform X1 [Mustela putorius furo]|uniref:Mitochondrial 2-oxoglutarate/malate carrier protein n=1 Tax=Mustela putorius furo TaxID=9669 RepID=A0A8U0SA99_MUSPF|nr:mitochondrial 2-oxoglutarate/malate carrier protein isoform X1 [Mustela putorius furo]